MRTYNAIPQQPTIHTAILSSFTAEGLTRQEALTQPRRAEVILRHDPFAASPYLITLSSPAFAFDGWGAPMRRSHVWEFVTFNEARAWFDELFEANADMIVTRQQPLKRERENTAVPWKVGDAAILSRLIPYDTWLARTQSRLDKPAAKSQTAVSSRRAQDYIKQRKPLWESIVDPRAGQKWWTRQESERPLQNGESFFSFGNC